MEILYFYQNNYMVVFTPSKCTSSIFLNGIGYLCINNMNNQIKFFDLWPLVDHKVCFFVIFLNFDQKVSFLAVFIHFPYQMGL